MNAEEPASRTASPDRLLGDPTGDARQPHRHHLLQQPRRTCGCWCATARQPTRTRAGCCPPARAGSQRRQRRRHRHRLAVPGDRRRRRRGVGGAGWRRRPDRRPGGAGPRRPRTGRLAHRSLGLRSQPVRRHPRGASRVRYADAQADRGHRRARHRAPARAQRSVSWTAPSTWASTTWHAAGVVYRAPETRSSRRTAWTTPALNFTARAAVDRDLISGLLSDHQGYGTAATETARHRRAHHGRTRPYRQQATAVRR